MNAISGTTPGITPSGNVSQGNRLAGGDEEERKDAKSLFPNEDSVSISEKARELLNEASDAKKATEEEEARAQAKKDAAQTRDEKDKDGVTRTVIEAIPDPLDPENMAKARIRVIDSGE